MGITKRRDNSRKECRECGKYCTKKTRSGAESSAAEVKESNERSRMFKVVHEMHLREMWNMRVRLWPMKQRLVSHLHRLGLSTEIVEMIITPEDRVFPAEPVKLCVGPWKYPQVCVKEREHCPPSSPH